MWLRVHLELIKNFSWFFFKTFIRSSKKERLNVEQYSFVKVFVKVFCVELKWYCLVRGIFSERIYYGLVRGDF